MEKKGDNEKEDTKLGNFVSYAWFTSTQSGFGCIYMKNPASIKNMDDVKGVNDYITSKLIKDKNYKDAKCVVINFQKFQTDLTTNN
jgi:hypothetical protein